MNNNKDIGSTPREDDTNNARIDYLKRAAAADEAGDSLLSMYLYLAAFQQAARENPVPNEAAITGLKQAWALACANKERSLAEYIFELMEPYLSADEVSLCAEELQNLALDKLEEFGLSREELENMANMISDDLVGMGAMGDPIIKIDQIISPAHPLKLKINKPTSGKPVDGIDDKDKTSGKIGANAVAELPAPASSQDNAAP